MSILDDMTEAEVVNAFLNGRTRREISAIQGISVHKVSEILSRPKVKDEIQRRFEEVASRVSSFKINAINSAAAAFDKLEEISQVGSTEEIKRLASLDIVKISGLMPRKRVLVESDRDNGVTEDARELIRTVLKEIQNSGDTEVVDIRSDNGHILRS